MALVPQSLKELQVSKSGADSGELTLDEFSMAWSKLCASYPKNEATALTVEVYFERLSAYEKSAVFEAIGVCMDECKWFPTIAEIVERIKSERGCIHRVFLAEIRSRRTMLIEAEKHSDRKLKELAEEIATLEGRKAELYVKQRKMIEESGLPAAQKKLEDVQRKIAEQERVLAILRGKVKIFDQARILQANDKPN